MKALSFLLILFFVYQTLEAQKKKRVVVGDQSAIAYEQGKSYYDKSEYKDAIPYFEEALKSNPESEDALFYLGACYRYTNQPAKAIEQFKKLEQLKPDYWPGFYYELAIAYSTLNQNENASTYFNTYLQKTPKDASQTRSLHRAQYRKYNAEQQLQLAKQISKVGTPIKLAGDINSKFGEYSPVLDPTGTRLYFTSTRPGGVRDEGNDTEGDEDLYVAEKEGTNWSKPKLLPEPVNSRNNDGTSCISADGQVMIFAGCNRDGGVGSCDLYISTLEGNMWSEPANMGNVVNSEEWDSQPTISSDGTKIIFASTRQGSYGSEDLYMIEKNMFGEWGPAMNLGSVINTPFTDYSPFFSQDGKTLYFSSAGHPGYGGNDIFKTVYENGKWSTPINLGKPLNTSGDDRFFTIGGSGEVGYFASDRETPDKLDLYEVAIPEEMRPRPTVIVEGVVTNSKTKEPVGAYVMLEDLNSGELIAMNKSNSVSGKYLVVLPAGRTYSVSANKEAFFFHSEMFDVPKTSKYQIIKKDIELKPIEKGAKIVLNNIFFETGKATLSPQSKVELEKAIALLKTNSTMVIEVGGHTDNVGDDAMNMKLSHDRAKSVRDYLVNGGISSDRVQAKGYGESNPVATNDTEEGRQANRRTEFIILEF